MIRFVRFIIGIGVLASSAHAADWIREESPHFPVLAQGSEKQARQWLLENEQFAADLATALGQPTAPLPRVTVVLFDRRGDLEDYLPLENGRPAAVAGFFSHLGYFNVIALSMDANDENLRHTIHHECVHWYFSTFPAALPPWFNEGVAEVYSTLESKDAHTFKVGAAITDHSVLLARNRLIPVSQLVSSTSADIHYDENRRTDIFYAESWALVHYLIFGGGGAGPHALNAFADSIAAGNSSDAAFRASIAPDYGQIQKDLEAYVVGGKYQTLTFDRPPATAPVTVAASRPQPAELELALGAALLANRRMPEASKHLANAAKLDPDNAQAWELLSSVSARQGDEAAESRLLRRAIAGRAPDAAAYFRLASLSLKSGEGAGSEATGNEAAPHDPVGLLRQGLALNPNDLPAWELFSSLLVDVSSVPESELVWLQAALSRYPNSLMLRAGVGAAEIKAGKTEPGIALLRSVATQAPPAAPARVLAESVLADQYKNRIEDATDRITAKVQGQDYEGAIKLATEALEHTKAADARGLLDAMRAQAASRQIVDEINNANLDEAIAHATEALAFEEQPKFQAEFTRLKNTAVSQRELNEALSDANAGKLADAVRRLNQLLQADDLNADVRSSAEALLQQVSAALKQSSPP